MNVVLDASAALAWLFERQAPDEAAQAAQLLDNLETQSAWVPALWHIEVANALLVAERRGVVTEAQISAYLSRLSQLPIETDATPSAARQEAVMSLARRMNLSAYDATYLDLALRADAWLATFDQKLAAAARGIGVTSV